MPSSHETNRYWLFPGPVRLASYRRQLDDMETERLAEQVNLAARLLAEYGDRTALFDEVTPLAKQELVARATQQQFYTVLLADDSPKGPESLADALRALRHPADEVPFAPLAVSSVEDAICAVALNGEIQAAIIRHDLPLRSRERLPMMNTSAAPQRQVTQRGFRQSIVNAHHDKYHATRRP